MFNLIPIKALYNFNHLKIIPQNILDGLIKSDNFIHPFISLIVLANRGDLSSYNFLEIQSYIYDLLNKIQITDLNEFSWSYIYLLMCATRKTFNFITDIITLYTQLPKLPENNTYYEWLQYQVKMNILTYYTYLNKDTTDILKEIQSHSEKIINFSVD